MKHVCPNEFSTLRDLTDLSAEEYLSLLHPEKCRGRASVLCKVSDDEVRSHSLDRDTMIMQLPLFLDHTSFMSLNRFWSGRSASKLASLNALYVDLDYFQDPNWKAKPANEVQASFNSHLMSAGVPQPSICMQTGRGLAAIWLINETPAAALPRWQETIRTLVEFSAPYGADNKCKDTSRVFRIPGTINEKSGKVVRVCGGTGKRYCFDTLSDQIFQASGRPTRSTFEVRKKTIKTKRKSKSAAPRGLTQSQRFSMILKDLEVIRVVHGGEIQVGYRNTWLHFFATCLTHIDGIKDIGGEIREAARLATPSLETSEVSAILRQAEEKARRPKSNSLQGGTRYYYRGSTIAEQLGITADMARSIGLLQVIPAAEKKRRKAENERQRRARNGASSRAEYESKNNASRTKPWASLGIGRTKYYELKKAGKLPDLEG